MNPVQFDLLEPTGDDLARLALKHVATADGFRRNAQAACTRGFHSSARLFTHWAEQSQAEAEICEQALYLERLAGLSC